MPPETVDGERMAERGAAGREGSLRERVVNAVVVPHAFYPIPSPVGPPSDLQEGGWHAR